MSAEHPSLVLVIGGASSGKSAKALELAGSGEPRVLIATGEALDDEMAERIRRHRRQRGPGWETAEVPLDLIGWFERNASRYAAAVLDCVTLWLSNLLGKGSSSEDVVRLVPALVRAMRGMRARVVVVTNELGLGLVPGDRTSRAFRDLAGQVNQQLARDADEVHLVVAGLSTRIK
ncbi:bifunctional adenosylcobinamide kinase/adenosylcobinamide-phosphate guanylyltransferase [Candidatus Nitrospira bockiana]